MKTEIPPTLWRRKLRFKHLRNWPIAKVQVSSNLGSLTSTMATPNSQGQSFQNRLCGDCKPSTQQAWQEGCPEFQASLDCLVSFRPTLASKRDPVSKHSNQGWKESLMVNHTHCSARGPESILQLPGSISGGSQLPVTPASGGLTPSAGLHRHDTHMHKHTDTHKTQTKVLNPKKLTDTEIRITEEERKWTITQCLKEMQKKDGERLQ